jgi:hypothetical protein
MIIANFLDFDLTLPGAGYTVAAMVASGAGQSERHENVAGSESAEAASLTGASYVAIGVAIRKA